jgi:hypothetical protein
MQQVWFQAALWLILALIATLLSAMIASAVIPTAIANAWFMPKHLLPKPKPALRPMGWNGRRCRRQEII